MRFTVSQFDGIRSSLTGFMSHPKAIVILMDNTIIMGLGLLCTRTSRASRVWIYLGIMAMLFTHLLTISRVDAVALFCGWLTFVYLHPRWRRKMLPMNFYMALSVLMILLILMAVLVVFYNGGEMFARLFGMEASLPGYRFSALQGRWDFLMFCLEEIWESGGLGRGSGGIMRDFEPKAIVMAPSLYASILVDHGLGIISIILFGWIGLNLILELHRAFRDCADTGYVIFLSSVAAGLVVNAVAGLGDHLYFLHNEWLMLGAALAVIKAAPLATPTVMNTQGCTPRTTGSENSLDGAAA